MAELRRKKNAKRQSEEPVQRQDDDKQTPPAGTPRPFWSGTITFGLVSLPVGLYPAQHGRAVSLRMVDVEGTRLRRRYVCGQDGEMLESQDLVRGYDIGDGQHVLVEDEELEALAPKKSREIDLRKFVPLDDIDPVFFLRGYFLTPEQGAIKAYRLLAQSMAESGRAGIATFVMRGHEYLIAILAEGGILRAETLRFADTLRTPSAIGLPSAEGARARDIQRLQGAIKTLMAESPDEAALEDTASQALQQRAQEKLEAGEDVLARAPEDVMDEEEGEAPPDLMAILKASLEMSSTQTPAARKSARRPAKKHAAASRKAPQQDNYAGATRARLYALAQERDIAGRSRMNRDQLAEALRNAPA